jgi:hypothetical protein
MVELIDSIERKKTVCTWCKTIFLLNTIENIIAQEKNKLKGNNYWSSIRQINGEYFFGDGNILRNA